jgi:hypothetical protein
MAGAQSQRTLSHQGLFLGSNAPFRTSSETLIQKPIKLVRDQMTPNQKFPKSVEIKRVIAAAIRAGIDIGSIEIHSDKIIIQPREKNAPAISDYDLWKMSEGQDTSLVRHTDKESGAP